MKDLRFEILRLKFEMNLLRLQKIDNELYEFLNQDISRNNPYKRFKLEWK